MIHSTRRVRKRDGREVPFDQSKIADAIYRAARSVGGGDPLLAEELGSVVALFIDKEWEERTPSIDDVSDLIEKVLVETGHTRTAKAFILERDRRARIRSALRVRHEEIGSGGDSLPKVDARSHATVSAWSKGKIVEALMVEGDVESAVAEEIASAVEQRVFASGLTRISTSLLRALVDNELFERGYERVLNRQVIIGMPRYDLDRMARSGAGVEESYEATDSVDRLVARSSWTHYSLLEVFPASVVEGHLSGRIHLGSLGAPTRYQALEVNVMHALRSPPSVGESNFDRARMLHRRIAGVVDETVRYRALDELIAHRLISSGNPDGVARELLLAYASPLDAPRWEPTVELQFDLRPSRAFLDGVADSGEDGLPVYRDFVSALLRTASLLGEHYQVPRLRLDITGATDDDTPLLELAALTEGAMDRGVMVVDPANWGTLSSYSPVSLHVAIDLAQAAFRVPRFDAGKVIEQMNGAIEVAAEACEARSEFLQSLPGGASPKERLRKLAQGDAAAVGGGRYEIGLVGVDAAARIAFDHGLLRDTRAAEFAVALIDAAGKSVKKQAEQRRLPLQLAYCDDSVVHARFGRIDFERYPRGRDVHGVSHDGHRYLYSATLGSFDQEPDPSDAAQLEARLRRGFAASPLPVYHSLAHDRVRFARLFAEHAQGDHASC